MSDHTSEYWVEEIVGVTSLTVARFDDEERAWEWAEEHYVDVYDGPTLGVLEGAAFIAEVECHG